VAIRVWTARSCIAAVSFMSVATSGFAFAQSPRTMSKIPTPHGNFYDACPPGHRLEFVVGSLTLFVDPHWLALGSEIPLWQQFGAKCPSQPITISSLYFHNTILDAANVPTGLGEPFFFFVIRDEATLPRGRMTSLELRDALPLNPTAEPYIEDVTRPVFRAAAHVSPSAHVYRLVYPGMNDQPPTSIEVSCGGEPVRPNGPGPGRTCFTPIAYSYLGGLTVKYEFRQDTLPAEGEKESPANAMREPEGVLNFDSHIRAWLNSLTKKP